MDLFKDAPVQVLDLDGIWFEERHLDDHFKDLIKFQEFLVVGRLAADEQSPTPVGAMCLNMQRGVQDRDKLVVYMRSQLDMDGGKGGSKITAWLDKSLHTIEEKRTEYAEMHGLENSSVSKQCLYVAVQGAELQVRHEQDTAEGSQSFTKKYPIALGRHLICEGASFILMRLLALHKFIGQFETATLYLNGDICRNVYMCSGPESGIVNGKQMDVCKIYRQVIEHCGIEHICQTTLTDMGRIVTHQWKDCEYVVYMNPLTDLSKSNLEPNEKVDWFSDLQLFSTYLDRKELCTARTKSYLRDRPEIKRVLADYVQTLLQMKPDDVIKFTMGYFKRFSD